MKTSFAKTERIRSGLTQKEVAGKSKIPPYKVSFYETGKLKLSDDELRRLGKVLGVDLENPEW